MDEVGSVAVIGSGAIGNLVATYLCAKDVPVTLVARPGIAERLRSCGLKVSGIRGDIAAKPQVVPILREKPALVILCVKTPDICQAMEDNGPFLQESVVVTVQNGVRADELVARYLPEENIVSSIVMFVASYVALGQALHNAEGNWILGDFRPPSRNHNAQAASLQLGQFCPTCVSDGIKGMKYLKIFLNANNCISAILNRSLQEAFSDVQVAKIGIALWREGFSVLSRLGIPLTSLPGFPLENLTRLLAQPPTSAAAALSGIMARLSEYPVYGSILQSIQRGRSSEIDYINGEFVALAEENALSAPLNRMLVELVHRAEKGKFLPKQDLIALTTSLVE